MKIQFTKDTRNRWTLGEFYASGATADLPDRYAESLINAGLARRAVAKQKQQSPNKRRTPGEDK